MNFAMSSKFYRLLFEFCPGEQSLVQSARFIVWFTNTLMHVQDIGYQIYTTSWLSLLFYEVVHTFQGLYMENRSHHLKIMSHQFMKYEPLFLRHCSMFLPVTIVHKAVQSYNKQTNQTLARTFKMKVYYQAEIAVTTFSILQMYTALKALSLRCYPFMFW